MPSTKKLIRNIVERLNRIEESLGTLDEGAKELRRTLLHCCIYYNIPTDKVRSDSRKGEVMRVRRMYCYIAGLYSGYSSMEIGEYIGIDRSTVGHHKDQIRRWILRKHPGIIREFKDLSKKIYPEIN